VSLGKKHRYRRVGREILTAAATGTLGPTGTPTGTSAATVSSLMKLLSAKLAADKFRVP